MKNDNDFLTEDEVREIFPEANKEQVEYIIATVAVMTDLFFEIIKSKDQ